MNRTWLITGASRGLGKLVAEKLLERGDQVLATVRNAAVLTDLQDRYGARLRVFCLDVSDASQVREVVEHAFAAGSRIDVIISNAGYGIYGAAEEITDDQLQQIIATNLLGSMNLARAALPHLRQQGGGRIIQMSSMAGHFGRPGFTAYHATKWGIEGFFEALADEVASFGIATSILAPGRFPTTFYEAAERSDPHPAYAAHSAINRHGSSFSEMPGDPDKLAEVIISVGDMDRPPRRLLLGSDAYAAAHAALRARLLDLEQQRDIAFSTDRRAAAPNMAADRKR